MIHDALVGAQFSYKAGASGTVTVPAGVYVTDVLAHASVDGATLTITPSGPGQSGAAGDAIPVPSGSFFGYSFLGQLGPGSVFVFTGTDSYFVAYAKFQAGAAR